jgi:hypothetical protein
MCDPPTRYWCRFRTSPSITNERPLWSECSNSRRHRVRPRDTTLMLLILSLAVLCLNSPLRLQEAALDRFVKAPRGSSQNVAPERGPLSWVEP